MVLKETIVQMQTLLNEMGRDLDKAEQGNKTAAQRVRTASVLFAKTAKKFRKESIAEDQKTGK